jgi:hypothetical protein
MTQQQKTLTVSHDSREDLMKEADATFELMESVTVDSPMMYELAADELRNVKTKLSELVERRLKITRPMDEAKKELMDLFRGPVERLEAAEKLLKSKMLQFSLAEQKKAEEQRLAAERVAQAERDRLAAEAKALDAQGRSGEAEVRRNIAEVVMAAPVATAAPVRAKGIATVKSFDYEVTDMLKFIQHVAANPHLVALLNVDGVKMRAQVVSLGLALEFPGVRVFEKQSISARRA